jgi:predicted dehydrogenase
VHKIDLMRYLVGEIARVTALSRTRQPNFIDGAEEYAVALLEFENGAIGELFSAYGAFRAPWGEHPTIFDEYGTIFGMTPQPEGQAPAMIASSTREAGTDFSPVEPAGELPTENGIVNEILHFADCCATGEEPLTSGRDNISTMRVIFAIYQSARTGEPVETVSLDV